MTVHPIPVAHACERCHAYIRGPAGLCLACQARERRWQLHQPLRELLHAAGEQLETLYELAKVDPMDDRATERSSGYLEAARHLNRALGELEDVERYHREPL